MRRLLAAIGVLQLATGLLAQTTTSSSSPSVYTVAVGANGHKFTPNTTVARPGDIIVFDFYPTNHSVIRGEYNKASVCGTPGCNPCVPWELYHTDEPYQGFFSDNRIIDSFTQRETWNLTVNSTDPIWFYCDALESCSPNGMVGVINPTNDTSIDLQHQQAVDSAYQLAPGQTWPAEGTQSTSSGSSHHSSKLSGGAIAGIVVGGVAFVAMAAALTFYIGRNNAYSKFFKHAHSQPPMSEIGGEAGAAGGHGGGGSSMPPWSDHTPSRMGSPPPTMPGSPPLGSEKPPNQARWSDSTAFSHQRLGSPPPQDHMTFVGYNRQTGAPEFSSELPGDHEIHQVGSPGTPGLPPQQYPPAVREEARVLGGSPVEMEAPAEARMQRGSKGAPPPV
ncbi:Cupredoxin [Neofusicoccum parvum]|nr:Cupredoxin [Neofusicoccum parvum]